MAQIQSEKSKSWADHAGIERGVPVTRWRLDFRKAGHRALRAFVFIRDGFTCRECGATPDRRPEHYDGSFAPRVGSGYLVVDHKISRCRGEGHTHHPSNLQTLCDPCNARKRNLVDIREADPCRA